MNRQVADDTSTSDIVWAAAERIGKTSNADDINRICEYLISKHWFQNAGDLRAARQNAQEWQALEVPGRLKIAMQEVLDARAETPSYSPGKLQVQASTAGDHKERPPESEPSLSNDVQTTAPAADLYAENVYSSYAYPSEAYVPHPSYDAEETYADAYALPNASTTTEACAEDGSVTDQDEAAAAAAHAAAWEAYYAANGYYQYYDESGAAGTSWNYGAQDIPADQASIEAVVEAEEVVVEEAVAAEEVADATHEWAPAVGIESAVPDPTWQCGQCTYANSYAVAFCEMCCGHISLSPDTPTEANQPPPVSIEPVRPEHESTTASTSTLDLPPVPPAYLTADSAASSTLSPPLPPPTQEPPSLPRPPPLEPPLYVSIPCPTESTSPLYSPSAPDFDFLTLEDPPTALRADPPSIREEAVKQLPVFAAFPVDDSKYTEVSVPLPTSQPSPSPPKIDYRALAFKRTPSMPSSTVSTGLSPQKSPVRSATEFSF